MSWIRASGFERASARREEGRADSRTATSDWKVGFAVTLMTKFSASVAALVAWRGSG